jgi:hypothetical protein
VKEVQPQELAATSKSKRFRSGKRYGGPFGYNFGEQQASSGKHLSDQRQIVNVGSLVARGS